MTASLTIPAPTAEDLASLTGPRIPAPFLVLDVLASADPGFGVRTVEREFGLSRRLAVRAVRAAVEAMPDHPVAAEWARYLRTAQVITSLPVRADREDPVDPYGRTVDAAVERQGGAR